MKTRHSVYFCLLLALTVFPLSSCQEDVTDIGYTDSPVLTLTESTVEMHPGETHRLSLTCSISGISWNSANDTVASVDILGTVTAHRTGETTVTVTRKTEDENHVTRTASCLIRVTE